jgi:lantibiotic modifying enzyme
MRAARTQEILYHSPDIFCGAAGYGLTCLKLWVEGSGEEFIQEALRIGQHLNNTVIKTKEGVCWSDETGTVPLGYAYGSSGIALFLLYLYAATKDQSFFDLGRLALDFELSQGIWRDKQFTGFPAIMVGDNEKAHVVPRCYWDAGSAGVVTTVVRYLRMKSDPFLEQWIPHLARDVSHKYAVMPQLFHGLTGLGNALLDIWQQTGDETYLSEAWQVGEGILLFGIERPEGLAFPGEQGMRESADFASGAAGIALFLNRLLTNELGIDGNFNFVVDELLPSVNLNSSRPDLIRSDSSAGLLR